MRRSRKPFGLYKVTRVRIPPPPPLDGTRPSNGAFLFWAHFNNAQEEGFEPDRARSVKKTRQRRVFSAARSAQADRINFELRSKFGHPSYSAHAPHHVQSRSKNPNMYITLQKRHFSTSLEASVHLCILCSADDRPFCQHPVYFPTSTDIRVGYRLRARGPQWIPLFSFRIELHGSSITRHKAWFKRSRNTTTR